ncbi:hypothetical protein M422DRAFT_247521 [Sphaerobolus stellatus SS14]|nr:hypothetical protein M422DRAFT_247521 [Sphaerobolus stellatus SS14]
MFIMAMFTVVPFILRVRIKSNIAQPSSSSKIRLTRAEHIIAHRAAITIFIRGVLPQSIMMCVKPSAMVGDLLQKLQKRHSIANLNRVKYGLYYTQYQKSALGFSDTSENIGTGDLSNLELRVLVLGGTPSAEGLGHLPVLRRSDVTGAINGSHSNYFFARHHWFG